MGQIRSGQFSFDAAQYAASPLRFDHVLARARESGEQVQCLCRGEPRPLVVRQVRGRHFLAVWPMDGAQHASWCPFFRDDEAFARRQERMAQIGLTDGLEDVGSLNYAAVAPGHAALRVAGNDDSLDPVMIPSLLGELWELSGLQRWMAGWTRDWTRVQRSLRATARRLSVHGLPLEQVLFVPRDGNNARGTPAAAEWNRLCDDLRQSRRRHLVLGTVRAVCRTPYGWRLDLASVPQPVFVASKGPARLLAACEGACTNLTDGAGDGQAAPVTSGGWLALLDVRVSPSGNVSAVDGHLQPVSGAYFLAEDREDATLADEMAAQGRSFTKRLPPACVPGDGPPLEDFVLYDGVDQGMAMLLLRPASPQARQTAAEFVLRRLTCGRRVWAWDVTRGARPDLPAVLRDLPVP